MKLFCRKYGSGPPLIILHGLYGSSDNWVTVARELSSKFTVYLPDQRNHGQSPHDALHDYASLAQDLLELTMELGIRRFFLAGHSMGGKAAVNFALNWPEKIYSLVIIDISPFRREDQGRRLYLEHSSILESVLSVDLNSIKSRSEAEAILSGKIESEKTRGFILKNLYRTSDNKFGWRMNAESLYANLEGIVDGLPGSGTGTDTVTGFPVTFVKGGESEYLRIEDTESIRNIFPAAEFITVKNAGHWIHAERPDAIIEILLKQLDL
jgi:esterase